MRATTPRTILLAGVLTLAAACGQPSEQQPEQAPEEQPLVVASFGGAWQEAQRQAMFEPFAERSGVQVVDVEYDGDYALIQEKGGAGEWDVVDVEPAELLRGAAEGLYERIDYSGVDREALLDAALHPYGAGLMTYAVVLGYDAAAFPRSIDYGPVNRLALDALPEDLLARLPTHPDHIAESVRFDAEWWLEHEDEAHRRYDAWLQRDR